MQVRRTNSNMSPTGAGGNNGQNVRRKAWDLLDRQREASPSSGQSILRVPLVAWGEVDWAIPVQHLASGRRAPAASPQQPSKGVGLVRRIFGASLCVLASLTFTAGCGKELVLQAEFGPEESVARRQTVFIDDQQGGHVRDVRVEGGMRIARLAVDEPSLAERLRVGTVRVPSERGWVELVTSAAGPDARRLENGEFVPRASKVAVAVRQAWSSPVLVGSVAGVTAFLLLALVFKRAGRAVLVLAVALPLAALTAWAATPPLAPLVDSWYGAVSTRSATTAQAGGAVRPRSSGAAEALRSCERSLVEVVKCRPDPHTVAFCGVLALTMPLYACLVSALIRACTRGPE